MAHEVIESTIEKWGPFQGVLGFSQGAAAAGSCMMQKALEGKPNPFNFAVLFSSVLSASADVNFATEGYEHIWRVYGDAIRERLSRERSSPSLLSAELSPKTPLAHINESDDSSTSASAEERLPCNVVTELKDALESGRGLLW